jgi:hypothetical protein
MPIEEHDSTTGWLVTIINEFKGTKKFAVEITHDC